MPPSVLLVPTGSATPGTESLAEESWGQLPAAPQEPQAVCTTEAALLGGKAVCRPPASLTQANRCRFWAREPPYAGGVGQLRLRRRAHTPLLVAGAATLFTVDLSLLALKLHGPHGIR